MKQPDENFLDGLLQILTEAPRTQIDEDIVADVKKFMGETHTYDEKYAFIQNISKEPLNMIGPKVGVGRITPVVQLACDLDRMFGKLPNTKPIEKPVEALKEIAIEERITVDQMVENQAEEQQGSVMSTIFIYMDDLMWAGQFKRIDEFMLKFCGKSEEICFQYHLSLLTTALWAVDKLDNVELLKAKTIAAGTKEYGKEETLKILKGLI